MASGGKREVLGDNGLGHGRGRGWLEGVCGRTRSGSVESMSQLLAADLSDRFLDAGSSTSHANAGKDVKSVPNWHRRAAPLMYA